MWICVATVFDQCVPGDALTFSWFARRELASFILSIWSRLNSSYGIAAGLLTASARSDELNWPFSFLKTQKCCQTGFGRQLVQ